MKNIVLLLSFISISLFTYAQNRLKVACVGDSITYGVGVSDSSTKSYPAQLATLLGNEYQVEAFGKSGATLLNKGHRPYTKEAVYQDALNFRPDIVIIHLGVNDTDPRNWPHHGDSFVKDYIDLIQSFKDVNPNVRVLVAEITPITNYHPRFISGTNDWQVKIRSAIKSIAQATGSDLIDFYSPLHSHPSMLPDAIHPNNQGAKAMAQVANSAITGNYGGLRMSMMYGDNMIIQRGKSINIKGIANSGELVKVKIGSQKREATANVRGEWFVSFLPLRVGTEYTLSISTEAKTLEYKNVAVGDVWLCSGQSNMAWTLKQANSGSTEIPTANNPKIRVYNTKNNISTNAISWSIEEIESVNNLNFYTPTDWQTLTPENAGDISAIAYYFGKDLQEETEIPIGLIINAVGGSNTESWIDRATLERELPQILNNWLSNDFIQPWVRSRAAQNIKNSPDKRFVRHPYEPTYLNEVGIKPLEQFPIKGIIWYQGESNAHNIEAHEELFTLLVKSWRENWSNPELPFYFVQLSSLNRPSWPTFRDSQRKLMEQIPHTGMVVSSDRGDSLDVHPRDKKDIGLRLARWALNKDYNKNITPSGPLFKWATTNNSKVYLTFNYSKGLKSSDGEPINGFEVAEIDGLYYPAEAHIAADKVVLRCKHIKNPKFVRYGWQPFTRANLVNEELLPASTFKIEL